VILAGIDCLQFTGGSVVNEGLFQVLHLALVLGILAVVGLVTLVPYWKIFKKAGFAPALSLLTLVPLVNVIVPFFLAFAEWPALKKSA
jgi:hypothetical protein